MLSKLERIIFTDLVEAFENIFEEETKIVVIGIE